VVALACGAVGAGGPGAVGVSVSGAELFTRADKGHCTACHEVASAAPSARRSDVGPKLGGARMRALGRERLREMRTLLENQRAAEKALKIS
jgi:cytochrome c2